MENFGMILIYEWEKKKEKKLLDFCSTRGIRVKNVPSSLYGETLGALAEISGIKSNGKKDEQGAFGEEMMVFAGIDSERLDIFLKDYKKEGIEPVQLKAILTPYNIFWNSRQLYGELRKEREAFQKPFK